MARILPIHLDDISINFDMEEMLYSAFHPWISEMYEEMKYYLAPKSKSEMLERGLTRGWNGLNSCFTELKVENINGRKTLITRLAPVRYLVGQAMRDFIRETEKNSETTFDSDRLYSISPKMANVSLVAPIEYEGRYYIIGQIKGDDVLGGGAVHAGIVAGNVGGEYLDGSYENPLFAALKQDAIEEIGMNVGGNFDLASIACIVDESETGQMNIASVVRDVNLETILKSYQEYTVRKIRNETKLEVSGLVLIPIDEAEGGFDYDSMITFLPTQNGLERVENYKAKDVRPYTQAFDDFFKNFENVGYIFEKGGINFNKK